KQFFHELQKEVIKQTCVRLGNAPRDLGVEAHGGNVSENDITAKLENRIIDIAKYVVTAQDETNRIAGKLDKTYVEVPAYKFDQETRVAAAKMLGEKNGSYADWSDDAKSDLNNQLKKQVEEALGLPHFKDFTVSMLTRPLRNWYQQQQEILGMWPTEPGS